MKYLLILISIFSFLPLAQAKEIQSEKNSAPTARIVALHNLVDKPHIRVNLLVQDLGGSTDVYPSKRAFFTIYARGEMFSTDASFELGDFLQIQSVSRVSGGIYELNILDFNANGQITNKTLIINAVNAIVKMNNVTCDDFDCDASTNFSADIQLTEK